MFSVILRIEINKFDIENTINSNFLQLHLTTSPVEMNKIQSESGDNSLDLRILFFFFKY